MHALSMEIMWLNDFGLNIIFNFKYIFNSVSNKIYVILLNQLNLLPFEFFINFLKSICWFHTLSMIYDTYLCWSQRPQHNKIAKRRHWQTRECLSISRPHLFIYSQLAKTKARTSKLKNLCGKESQIKSIITQRILLYHGYFGELCIQGCALFSHLCNQKVNKVSIAGI